MTMLFAAADAAPAVRISADAGSWIWIVIVIYLIGSAIGAIRRALGQAGRRAAQASGSPAERQLQTVAAQQAAQEATSGTSAARRARRAAPAAPSVILTAGQTSARSAVHALDAPSVSVQPAREALAQILARMLQAQTEPVDTSAAAPMGVTVPSGAAPRPDSSAQAMSALPEPIRATPAAATPAVDLSDLTARLGTPAGLAFAVVAAAVVGPPQALRTEPQEPGGW